MYELKLNLAVHGMYGIFVFFQQNVFYNIDSALVRYWYLKNIRHFCTICLPQSGQENVKNSRQVVIFGVIFPFYKGQNGSKFSQNRSGQAGRG